MKAVLVIDIADDIADVYGDFTVDYDLRGTPKDDQKVNESIRYVEDCPLKPMPQEQNIYEIGIDEEDTNAKRQWNKGWNACIDAITGGTE